MKKLFKLTAVAAIGYVAWLWYAQEVQSRAAWTKVTDSWKDAKPIR